MSLRKLKTILTGLDGLDPEDAPDGVDPETYTQTQTRMHCMATRSSQLNAERLSSYNWPVWTMRDDAVFA